jgi:hypothetical protein
MANTTRTQYRVVGLTDEATTCEQCGKEHLKRTVILAILDADGNPTEAVYMGTTCAGRATGTPSKRIGQQADAAMRTAARRVAWAQEKLGIFAGVAGDDVAAAALWFRRNPHMREGRFGEPGQTDADAVREVATFVRWGTEMVEAGGIPPAGNDWPTAF